MADRLPDEIVAEGDYGPAMAALDARKRCFVETLLEQRGSLNASRAATAAGYSTHLGAERVRGHRLLHNPRIIAALHEESRRRFTILGYQAVVGLAQIADTEDHPDRFKALKELADRFGYAAVTEHKVKVEHSDVTGEALIGKIRALADKLGVDEQKLLGGNVAKEPQVIEGEFQEVKGE